MPKYRVNGDIYNIPDDKAAAFEKRYPNATVDIYDNDGEEYALPVSEKTGFQEQFKNWSYSAPSVPSAPSAPSAEKIDTGENPGPVMPTPEAKDADGNVDWRETARQELEKSVPEAARPNSSNVQVPERPDATTVQEPTAASAGEHVNAPIAEDKQEVSLQQANREQVADLSSRIDDMLNQAQTASRDIYVQEQEEARKGGVLSTIANAIAASGHNPEGKMEGMSDAQQQTLKGATPELQQDIATLEAAKRAMSNAQEVIAEADKSEQEGKFDGFIKGVARGFGDKFFDVHTWDMGVSDTKESAELLRVLTKFDKGEPLSEAEQMLLDAKSVELATNAYFGSYIGRGYKAGSVTAQSLPFMIEMAINPASTVGESAQSMLARYAMRRFGKKAVAKAAGIAGRAVGDIAGSAIMAGTTGSIHVAGDAIDRYTGDIKTDVDDDGRTVFVGHGDGESLGKAIAKAFTATAIENHSEMLGEYFSPVLGALGAAGRKVMNKVGLEKAVQFIDDVNASDLAKLIDDFQKQTKWNGTIGEYAEEVAGNIENAILVGDQTLDTDPDTGVFNFSQNIDTFLGVSLMGGAFSAVRTASYRTPKYRARKDMIEARDKAAELYGEERWKEIEDGLADAGDEGLTEYLTDAIINETDLKKKAALLDYAGKIKAYEGALKGNDKHRELSGPEMTDLETSYENGYTLATPQEVNDAKMMFEYQQQRLRDNLNLDDIDIDDVLFGNEMGSLTDEQKSVAMDYLNAKATYDGVLDHVRDDLDTRVAAATNSIDSHVNVDNGQIVTATLKQDDRKVYIIGGNVVMTPDGTMVDSQKSEKYIIIKDAETGQISSVDPTQILRLDGNLDPVKEKENARQQIMQTLAQQEADKIDGVLPFNQGDTYQLTAEDGQSFPVQVVANEQGVIDNGDGTVNVVLNNDIDSTTGQPRITQMAKEQIQSMAEATNIARLQQHELQKTEERMRAAEEERTSRTQSAPYHINDRITITDAKAGELLNAEIVSEITDDGKYEVEVNTGDGEIVMMYLSPEELSQLDAQLVSAKIIDAEPEMVAQEQPEIAQEQPKIAQSSTEIEQETALSRIPVDKNGDAQFEEAQPSDTWKALVEMNEGDAAEAEDTAKQMFDNATKELDKAQKAKPKAGATVMEIQKNKAEYKSKLDKLQAKVAYWSKVLSFPEAERKPAAIAAENAKTEAMQQANDNLAKGRKIMQEKGTYYKEDSKLGDYLNFEDFALRMIANGRVKFVWKSDPNNSAIKGLGAHLGFEDNENERKRVFSILANADKGGLRPDEAAQELAEIYNSSNDNESIDTMQALDTILDIIRSYGGKTRDMMNAAIAAHAEINADERLNDISFDEHNATELVSLMSLNAEPMPNKELTPENWDKEFGESGEVDTPVGVVKMGENQLAKLFMKGRTNEFGMIKPTLNNPDVIVEEYSNSKNDDAERESSYLFVKTFERNGEKIKFFTSVTVRKDGLEVVISNHFVEKNALVKKITEGNIIYIKEALFSNSSEKHLAENQNDLPDLLPTQENNASSKEDDMSSGSKDTNIYEESNIESEKPVTEQITEQRKIVNTEPTETKKNEGAFGLVSDDRMAELKERLRKKLGGQLNMGIDPEILAIGMELAVGHIDRGIKTFADFSKKMIEDLGDVIRPYLKAFYNGARDLPEVIESGLSAEMTPYDEVRQFNVATIGENGVEKKPTVLETAEQVSNELTVQRNADEVEVVVSETENTTNDAYSIAPAQYTTKRGKVLDMFLVKPNDELGTSEHRDANARAREMKGWWDKKAGGFMLRSEEDARQFAEQTFRNPIGTTSSANEVQAAREITNTNPTEAQKKAGNYSKGHIKVDGYDIVLENPKGSIRSGKDANGKAWSITMNYDYGYISRTEGVDGDHIDVYLSANPASGKVYVVDQINQSDGSFDEHKVMYGFPSMEAAREAYASQYEDGWKVGPITEVSREEFKKWVESSHRKTKPFVEYKNVKKTAGQSEQANEPIVDARDPKTWVGRKFFTNDMILKCTSADANYAQFDNLTTYMGMGFDVPTFQKMLDRGEVAPIKDKRDEQPASEPRQEQTSNTSLMSDTGPSRDEQEVNAAERNAEKKSSTPFKVGDKVMYKGEEATIYDIDNGKPVLDTGLAPVMYEMAEWTDLSPVTQANENKQPKNSIKKKKSVSSHTEEADLFSGLFDEETLNSKDNENGLQRNDAVRSEGLSADSDRDSGTGSREDSNEEVREEDRRRTDRSGEEGDKGTGYKLQLGNRRSFGRLQGLTEDLAPSERKNTHNNHSERGENHAPTSVDARIEANIEAIELAQQLIDSGEQATEKQMQVLRKFSGWGGLGKAFSDSLYSAQLQNILGAEAYQDAVMSANSAYYTPAYVVDTLWDIAGQLGFKGGNILEGSAGIGNILGQMPANISERSDIHAIEIDGTSGNILSLLYPDAKVDIQGFEQTRIPNGSVDLAITNVPFVTGLRVNDTTGDKDLSKKFHNIHDFCIAKNVRKLREGGLGIFITSNGTLDNSKQLRDWIVSEGGADFIGAFRMNNKTFGGTGVTSDIIVIRKRVNGKKSSNAIDVSTITGERSVEYDTGDTRKVKGQTIPVIKHLAMDYNRYFVEHPENMAGVMRFAFEQGDTFRPTAKGLYPETGKNQERMLADFVSSFKEERDTPAVSDETNKAGNEYVSDESANDRKLGELYVKDGKLVVAGIGGYSPLAVNDNKVKGHTKVECFKAYAVIKDALAEVLKYQTENENDSGLKPLLAKLNKAYDDFVATYGHFNKNTAISFLSNDVDYADVFSLEKYEETGDKSGKHVQKFGKADVFSQRVVEKEKEPNPTNVKDGIIASVFKFGRIDVPYIANKLGRSVEDIKKEIISSGYGFEDPATKQMELSYQYLSGNVREKLRQAEVNNDNGEYDGNIKALQKVIPMDIPAHLIDFTLGSSWIAPKLYEEYVKDKTDIDVKLTAAGGSWFMDTPYYVNNEKNRSMGVYSEVLHTTVLGHTLIEAAIQNKTITVSRTSKKWDGSTETITDKDATQACAAKIDEIRQDFKDWARQKMQSDSEMSDEMERIYNDTFNNYVPMSIPEEFAPKHFEGQALIVKGKEFSMFPHQSKAVVRGTMQPLLLAHEVGTGKTFTLISTAMEMRRLGTARKPMIVVQNATVGQFVASAKELYPNAKILTIEEADRTADGRKNFYAKIRYNDWDMIVVPQSTFEFIPDSEERQMQFVQDKIEEKKAVLENMQNADPRGESMITRQAKKEISDLEAQLAELSESASKKRSASAEKKRAVTLQNAEVKALEMLDRRTDDVENFDDMGIDALLIDEAHEYKHLGFATAMQRGVKGVDSSYSKKSQGVYLKTQAVLENNNGRNVIFATGTPISNTAAEIWTFMRYLMPADTMKEYGIYYFDDFVRNFGNIQQMLEFNTNGKFKETNRFAGYINLPELVRIWSGISDTVLTKEAGDVQDKIPDIEGGKAQDLYLPQTKALRSIMKFVKSELQRYEQMSGREKKENSHIPLTMYGIAKSAAVDARLVSDAEDDPNSKTNEAVRQTMRSLKETASYKGTVAIFSDNYQNKKTGFNLYDDIRNKLIAQGVPDDEVVVIRPGMTVKKKLEIFDKVNRGEIRVVLGSTYTLGTGVNIQERLHTLIHLDAPNRPMDYTQRNGRILRQGNLHKAMGKPVRILRFGVEDSLDVTAYQRLKTKGAIADSIMNGKQMMANNMTNRVLEEEEDVFGDTIAQLSGSEYAMLKNNAEKNVRKFESRKKQWEADQTYIHNAKTKFKAQIAEAEKRAETNRKFWKAVEQAFPGGKFDSITAGSQTFSTAEEMADFFKEHNKVILDKMKQMKEGGDDSQTRELTVRIGNYSFKVRTVLKKDIGRNGGQLFSEVRRQMTYSCPELGLEDVPVYQNLLRNAIDDIVQNVITGKNYAERVEKAEADVKHYQSELKQVESREGVPFEYAAELEQARNQYAEYSELMKKEMEEKEAKYAEMDKDVEAVSDISTSEEDDDDIRYRDSGQTDAEYMSAIESGDMRKAGRMVEAAATDLAERLDERIRIVRDVNEIENKDKRVQDSQRKSKGWFNTDTGEIVVVLPNASSIEDVQETILHEAVGHKGLRELVGDDRFDDFLDKVYAAASLETRKKIVDLAKQNHWNFRLSTEEYIAGLSETGFSGRENRTWFGKIKDFFLDMLSRAKIALGFNIGDNELRYMLWRTYQMRTSRGILAKANDMAIQQELKVGNFREDQLRGRNGFTENDIAEMETPILESRGTFAKLADAEKWAKENLQGKTFVNSFTGDEINISGHSIKEMLAPKFSKAINEKTHMAAIMSVPDFIETGIPAEIHKDTHGRGYDVMRLYNAIVIDGELYRVKSTVKRYVDGDRYYTYEIQEMELLKGTQTTALGLDDSSRPQLQSSITGANLLKGVKKTNSDEEILSDNDSRFRFRSSGNGVSSNKARDIYEEKTRVIDKNGRKSDTANLMRRLKEAYVDSMQSLKYLQDAISEETGKPVEDFENAYLAENSMSSKNKAQTDIYLNRFFNPIKDAIRDLQKEGAEYGDIVRYLMAKHGLERNEVFSKRDAEKDGGVWDGSVRRDYSGLTELTRLDSDTKTPGIGEITSRAERIVGDFEKAHNVDALWDAINKATKETLHTAYVSGKMTKENYNYVRSMFKYYIPLRGWKEDNASAVYDYLSEVRPRTTSIVKAATGRTSISDDPIATIAYMGQNAIIQGNRELMKQKLLNLAINHKTSLLTVSRQWEVIDPVTGAWEARNPIIPVDATAEQIADILSTFEKDMKEAENNGLARISRGSLDTGKHVTQYEGQEHVVRVMRGGVHYCIYVNGNPRAAQAVNGMTNPDASDSWLIRRARGVKNFMARMFTSQNPAFIVTNLSRDLIFAGTAVFAKEDGKYAALYTKNITAALAKGQMLKLIYKFEHDTLDDNIPLEKYFKEFIKNGGETGFTQLNTVDDFKRDIDRFAREMTQGQIKKIPTKVWNGIWDSVEFMNRCAEDTTRFSVYMTSRQMGRSIEKSISDAKEVTVNFNRKGSGTYGARAMNFAYIFFNAAVQSLANAGKILYEHPVKATAALMTFSAAGFVAPLLAQAIIAAFGGDDDSYWDLPEWVRRNNFVFYIPWSKNKFLIIPISQELRPFYAMGEIAMSVLMGKEEVLDGLKSAAGSFMDLLPIDFMGNGGNLAISLTPTVAQPFAQLVANTDYFGKPIYRRNDWNEKDPGWTKAYKGTNSMLVDATKWLNEVSGGDNVVKGWIDVNPAVVEHLYESYLGGVGKTLNKTVKTLSMIWDPDSRVVRNVPIVSTFIQDADDERTAGSQLNREYNELMREFDKTDHKVKGYKKQIRLGAMEYADKLNEFMDTPEFQRYSSLYGYVSAIRKIKSAIKYSPDEDIETLKQSLNDLKSQMVEEMENMKEGNR